MKTSPAGIALIKQFEGCRLGAYNDGVGIWTIGWGTTGMVDGVPVHPGMQITQEKADALLLADLEQFEKEVTRDTMDPVLGEGRTPTQNQFDAMVCFCYNVGPGNYRQSTVLRRFLQGDFRAAADGFLLFNKAGRPLKVMLGLTRRREAERALFLSEAIAAQTS